MMRTKLTELCYIQYGYAFDSKKFIEDSNCIPLVRIRDVKRGFSETYYSGEYPKEYIVQKNDLLVGMDGEFSIARWQSRDALLNQRVCKIIAKQDVCEEYLRFALAIELKAIENRTAFVTVKHLSAKELNKIEFDIPEYSIQEKIAKKLNIIEQIICCRKQQIQQLDELVKARFVELFGDPFDTTKWTVKTLKDVSESMVDGSNVNPDYYGTKGEVLFLRIQNVWRNEFRLDDSVYITQEINQKHYYDTSLKTGDLLITKIGRYYTKDSSLGRVSVYRGNDDCANYSNNIMRVRLNDSVNSEFVNTLLNLDDYQSYIKRTSKGGTDKRALSKSLIGSYPIIIPPKALQDEFVSFIKQTDKSKVVVQKALDEAQTLFDRLMQEYFG